MLIKLKHLLQRAVKYFKNIRNLSCEYDLRFALAAYFDKLFPPEKKHFYIRSLTRYMRKEMRPITDMYRERNVNKPILPKCDIGSKMPIWVCWWQGEEAMPPVVKACIERLKAILPAEKASLHLITETNVDEYIDLPERIVRMRRQELISAAHYTDYLRYELIYAYGGIWLDATVYLSSRLDERLFKTAYFTQRFASWKSCPHEACRGKWNNFYFSAEKGSLLCSYICDALQYWHGRHDTVPDYVFLDYIYMAAYIDVPAIRELIDAVPPNNEKLWVLSSHLDDAYSPERYEQLMNENGFFKLTYKRPILAALKDGSETIGCHLLHENGVYTAK